MIILPTSSIQKTEQLANKTIMAVDPELACGFMGNIGQLWLYDQFVDLQIQVGDILFNCHRFILCACSKFFKVLLKSEIKDEAEHQIRQVNIRGISPEIFQLVLEAVYKGQNGITPDNMMEVWHAAHQLQIPVLVSKCETIVSSHLSQESFVNIYQNALLLQSVNVIKAAFQFVAQNFESFKDSEILLQQPASFIEDIIGSESLVGQSQNHIVEFILKWVNYELCARESEHVCGGETKHACTESAVQDLSTQINELTVNKNGSVEVILQKLLAASSDTDDTAQPFDRKLSLGKLLKLVRFSEVSKGTLELLADNDLVMGCKETRDIVRQALDLVNSNPTSTTPTSARPTSTTPNSTKPIDTEDTVVFVMKENTGTVYAYSLDRGDILQFLRCKNDIINLHTHHHTLLCTLLYNSKNQDPNTLQTVEFPFSEELRHIAYVRSDSMIVGDFCYTFREENMYRMNFKNYGSWYLLSALSQPLQNLALTVFKDSVLFYNSTRNEYERQRVFCFNTVTRKHWLMMTCEYENCDFVTFTHDEQFYILYGNGVFVNVTYSVTSPAKAFSLPKYSGISKSSLLWNFQFKIYGAVVHRDSLIVFGNLSSVLVSEIHECQIPGLKTIKFIHLFGLLTKCYPLVIPKKLLTQRM